MQHELEEEKIRNHVLNPEDPESVRLEKKIKRRNAANKGHQDRNAFFANREAANQWLFLSQAAPSETLASSSMSTSRTATGAPTRSRVFSVDELTDSKTQ